jgi:tRNA pseudouridine13 synthase
MKSPYPLDRQLGLEHFITDTRGIGGRLRTLVEDFRVEELCREISENPNGEYLHFTLEKDNWETIRAIKAIARALKVSHKRFGFAGTKDKRAITRQRISVWKVAPGDLEKLNIKGIDLCDFKRSDERISLGEAMGNRFRVTIRNIALDRKELRETLSETAKQIKSLGMPNYFGYQRFGTVRPNTHLVGKKLVVRDLEGAVMEYLASPYEGEKKDAYEARALLQDTKDFKKALEVFPKRLNYERSMLDALIKNPRDYAGALRRLPKKLRWMLVHAYQGFLFNKILSKLIEKGMDIKGRGIPLFGYGSTFSEGMQGEIEKEVIEEEGISFKDFRIKSMPELSSEGLLRDASIDVEPVFEIAEDEVNEGMLKCAVEFSLPMGSYATVLLREFMKSDPLNY